MTERGLPSVEGAQACPFVAFEHDRDERATSPDHRHRCYAEARPAPRAIAHQEAYCLSSAFPVCPIFQDWARREAAHPTGAGVGAATAAGGGTAAGGMLAGRGPERATGRTWSDAPPWPTGDLRREPVRRDEDEDDDEERPAAGFATAGRQPGSGLAGSPADRVAMGRGAVEPAGAAPAWPATDDRGILRRTAPSGAPDGAAGGGAGAAAGGAAAGGGAVGAGMAGAAGGFAADALRGAMRDDADDDFYDEDHVADRRDWGQPDDRDRDDRDRGDRDRGDQDRDRGERDRGERRGFFGGRDKRPKVGDTRPRREEEQPSWERAPRYEAYPTIKARRGPGISRIVIAALALFVAAIAVFLLPGFLGVGGPSAPIGPTPSAAPSAAAASVDASVEPTPVPTPSPFTYTVARGDTLTRIARKFGVTVDQIVAANPTITDPNKVSIGDILVIPTPGPSEAATAAP